MFCSILQKKQPPKPVFDEAAVDADEHEVEEEDDGDFEDTILSELIKKVSDENL